MVDSGFSPAEVRQHLVSHYKDYSIWLTTYGRKTASQRVVQIWFAYLNADFYVLSRNGYDSWWAKNILKDPHIIVNVAGMALKGTAEKIEDEAKVDMVWRYYRGKYRFYPQTYFLSWKKRKLFRMVFSSL